MDFRFVHRPRSEMRRVDVPGIGLGLDILLQPEDTGGAMSVIETTNAPGFGPPVHRHAETEVFRILEGRYLFEVGGARFHAVEGEMVVVPGGTVHGFVNVAAAPSRQLVVVTPGWDSIALFEGLAAATALTGPERADALATWQARWRCDLVGPPLRPDTA